ncbi:MAG: sterol desaturase family protein, partial [Bdellovibrionota bacterium]
AKHRFFIKGATDTLANIIMYAGSVAINSLWLPIAYAVYEFIHRFSLFELGPQWWLFRGDTPLWHWVLLFVLDDFCFYVFHRTSHRVRLLWASHVAHHSSNQFNLSVGLRQTWLPFFAIVFWIPLALLGFEPLMIMAMQVASLFIQALVHTQMIRSFGPFDWIFNSPSHHRVHHGSQDTYVDKNFAGVLIVWDRFFGTFVKESETPVYGIGHPTPTHNPLAIAFGEFVTMAREALSRKPKNPEETPR